MKKDVQDFIPFSRSHTYTGHQQDGSKTITVAQSHTHTARQQRGSFTDEILSAEDRGKLKKGLWRESEIGKASIKKFRNSLKGISTEAINAERTKMVNERERLNYWEADLLVRAALLDHPKIIRLD